MKLFWSSSWFSSKRLHQFPIIRSNVNLPLTLGFVHNSSEKLPCIVCWMLSCPHVRRSCWAALAYRCSEEAVWLRGQQMKKDTEGASTLSKKGHLVWGFWSTGKNSCWWSVDKWHWSLDYWDSFNYSVLTFSGSPPNAAMFFWTHFRAKFWSQSPRFPGMTSSPVERNPNAPNR